MNETITLSDIKKQMKKLQSDISRFEKNQKTISHTNLRQKQTASKTPSSKKTYRPIKSIQSLIDEFDLWLMRATQPDLVASLSTALKFLLKCPELNGEYHLRIEQTYVALDMQIGDVHGFIHFHDGECRIMQMSFMKVKDDKPLGNEAMDLLFPYLNKTIKVESEATC